MAEALYRKYRPQVFSDVVGQEHIEQTLRNAIQLGKVSHAYLFTGPRGTGKTTTARLLAKALLCEKGPTPQPDGICEDCELIARGEHPDVYELDAASRTGVESVREEIIGRVQFAPTRGGHKVYIIDEVHMLSTAAFNALLKTLEEPPSHVVFILCTTDPQKVPETIHSRCQRFDFRRISLEYIVGRLGAICESEGVAFEGEALELIAHRAEGGMRNALTALEQVISFSGSNVTLKAAEDVLGSLDSSDLAEIVFLLGKRDVAGCFAWVSRYVETGSDLAQFTRDLAEHVRNLYVMSLSNTDVPLDVTDAVRCQMKEQLQWYGPDRLARMMGVLGDLTVELKTSTNPRLSFEIACTRLVRPDSDLTLESLAERIEALESGYSAVAHVPAGAVAAQQQAQSVQQPVAQEQVSTARRQMAQQAQQARQEQPQAQQQVKTVAQETKPSRVVATTAEPEPVEVEDRGNAQAIMANVASLQRAWQATINLLKRDKPAYAVLLMNAKAVYDEAKQMMLVSFPKESDFAFRAMQKPEATDELAAALQATFGSKVPFAYVQQGAVSKQPQQAAQQQQAAAQSQREQQPDRQQAQPQQQIRQPQPEQRRQSTQQAQPMQQRQQARQRVQQPAQPTPEPYYDEVPLDAYDGMAYSAPSYDDVPPWEPTPQRAAQPARQQQVSVQQQARQEQAQPQQAAVGESPEQMGSMLSNVFGQPIRFE